MVAPSWHPKFIDGYAAQLSTRHLFAHLSLLPNGRNCDVFLFTLRVGIFGIVRSTTTCLIDPTYICLPKICPICSGHEETPSHFLFECSQKLVVWSSLWDSQFELPFSTYSLRRAIFLLKFPKCRSNTSTVLSIFLRTFLLALWRNHWSFVFD